MKSIKIHKRMILSFLLFGSFLLYNCLGTSIKTNEDHIDDVEETIEKVYECSAFSRKLQNFEMVVQKGHSGLIDEVHFLVAGDYIISKHQSSNEVVLWRKDGVIVKVFSYQSMVQDIDVSEDGKSFACVQLNRQINIFNIETLEEKILNSEKKDGMKPSIRAISLSADGKYLVAGTQKGMIAILDIDNATYRFFEQKHDKSIRKIYLTNNEKNIISLDMNDEIKIWDIEGNLLNTIHNNEQIKDISVAAHEKYFLTVSDKIIKIWDIEARHLRTIKQDDCKYHSTLISPDAKLIITGSNINRKYTVSFWNFKGEFIDSYKQRASSICLSADKSQLVYGGWQTIVLFDFTEDIAKELTGISCYGLMIEYDQINNEIISASNSGNIITWDFNGKVNKTYSRAASFVAIDFNSDQNYLVTINPSIPDNIQLFNRKIEPVKKINLSTKLNFIQGVVAFSNDGKSIYCSGVDKVIRQFSLQGELLKEFIGNNSQVTNIVVSRDDNYMASCAGKRLIIWDKEGKKIIEIKGDFSIIDMAFSKDSQKIIYGDGPYLKLGKIDFTQNRLIEIIKVNAYESIKKLAFLNNEQYVVTGIFSGILKIINLKDGKIIKELFGHRGTINSIEVTKDDKYIISSANDSTIRIWNIDSGDSVSFLSDTKEWAIYTDDGYFDCSINGGSLVKIRNDLEIFEVDQFAIRNNRPDIILKRLDIENMELIDHYYEHYQKRLKKLDIKEDQLAKDLYVPEANIISKRLNDKHIELYINLTDYRYQLKRYNIYANNVPLFGTYGKEINGHNVIFTEKIELTSGVNKIEISCINEKGAESFRTPVYANYKNEVNGNLYFIGFGISKYNNSQLNLKYADKDVRDLAEMFFKMKGTLFNDVIVNIFQNEEVTTENIRIAKNLLNSSRVDDTFVLFIAGHGLHTRSKENTYYFLTYNADIDNIEGTCAEFSLIEDLLINIAPRKKLFIIDTCESGEIEEDLKQKYYYSAESRGLIARAPRGVFVIEKKEGAFEKRKYLYDKNRFIFNDLLRHSGAIVFSSCKGYELSYEKDSIQNGVFTEKIINCFSDDKADKDKDGKISTTELRNYVIKNVAKDTNYFQNPTVDWDNIYQIFAFPIINDEK